MARTSVVLVLILLVTGAGVATPAPAIRAQENPDSVPEFTIVATTAGFEIPETLVSGWYFVTLDNQTEQDVVSDIAMLPADQSVEALQTALSTTSGASTAPAWLEQVVFAGGPFALPQSTAEALIELTPGVWTVLEAGKIGGPSTRFTVVPSVKPAESPGLAANVTVTISPTELTMPAEILNGYQVWSLVNTDARAHAIALLHLPAAISYDAMLAMLISGIPPDDIDKEQVQLVGGTGLLSGNHTIWTSFELAAGTYAVLDYVPQADGRTYAEIGFLAVFAVN